MTIIEDRYYNAVISISRCINKSTKVKTFDFYKDTTSDDVDLSINTTLKDKKIVSINIIELKDVYRYTITYQDT